MLLLVNTTEMLFTSPVLLKQSQSDLLIGLTFYWVLKSFIIKNFVKLEQSNVPKINPNGW